MDNPIFEASFLPRVQIEQEPEEKTKKPRKVNFRKHFIVKAAK